MRSKVINVWCRCGQVIFKYNKVGAGKLIKCYLSRILVDNVHIPLDIHLGANLFCPLCKKRIGIIYGIKGVRAVKLNQGQIRPFRLG